MWGALQRVIAKTMWPRAMRNELEQHVFSNLNKFKVTGPSSCSSWNQRLKSDFDAVGAGIHRYHGCWDT